MSGAYWKLYRRTRSIIGRDIDITVHIGMSTASVLHTLTESLCHSEDYGNHADG